MRRGAGRRPTRTREERSEQGKVVINLATGLEDPEKVTVAFLVGGAAAAAREARDHVPHQGGRAPGGRRRGAGRRVRRLPADPELAQQYADAGGELLVCPICWNARKLDEGDSSATPKLGGATPLWEWIGDGATVFSY